MSSLLSKIPILQQFGTVSDEIIAKLERYYHDIDTINEGVSESCVDIVFTVLSYLREIGLKEENILKYLPGWSDPLGNGSMIVHEDFARIMDESSSLQPRIQDWNYKMFLGSASGYIQRKIAAREKVKRIYELSLNHLSDEVKQKVLEAAESNNLTENIILFAMPYYWDNEKLWNSMGLIESHVITLPWFAKVYEPGLLFASAITRSNVEEEHHHDLFLHMSDHSNGLSLSEAFAQKGDHEGSHSIIDTIIDNMLKIGRDLDFKECYVGALGDDGREYEPTEITLAEFLRETQETIPYDRNYKAGPRVFRSVFNIVQRRLCIEQEPVWSVIVAAMFNSSYHISQREDFSGLSENDKRYQFYQSIIHELEISIEDLEKEYNRFDHFVEITAKNGHLIEDILTNSQIRSNFTFFPQLYAYLTDFNTKLYLW